jgi:hypothetical protein
VDLILKKLFFVFNKMLPATLFSINLYGYKSISVRLYTIFLLSPLFVLGQEQIGQDIDGEFPGDQSGWSVSSSSNGSVIAIGSPTNNGATGHVRVFENQLNSWVQLGTTISGEAIGDRSGLSVSISADGNVLAIGAPRNNGNGNDSGHVRVYENQSGTWVQIGQDIDGESAFNRFGTAVSLSSNGEIIAIGGPFNSANGSASGHVRVYENQSGTWVQIGQDIDGEGVDDFSGSSVSLSLNGNTVAVGAPFNDSNGNDSGHVRVYENQSGNWVQIGQDLNGEASGDQFGSAVSLSFDGRILAIGAPFNNANGSASGHVRVYENQFGNWVQIGDDIKGESGGDLSGWSLSLSADGDILALSSPGYLSSRGHTRIYKYESGNWLQVGMNINGEFVGDFSGRSVDLASDGSTIFIGANRNNNDAGHVRAYDVFNLLSNNDFLLSQNINIYPNPARDTFRLDLKNGAQLKRINIYNHLGQFILSSNKQTVSSIDFTTGLYIIEILTDRGKSIKKLIIK